MNQTFDYYQTECAGTNENRAMSKPKHIDLDERLNVKTSHEPLAPDRLLGELQLRIINYPKDCLSEIRPALNAYPTDAGLLIMAALGALLEARPDQSLVYQKRFGKRYNQAPATHLLNALALAQKGNWSQAERVIKQHGLTNLDYATEHLPCGMSLIPWVRNWVNKIGRESRQMAIAQEKQVKKRAPRPAVAEPVKASPAASPAVAPTPIEDELAAQIPALPTLAAQIPVAFNLPQAEAIALPQEGTTENPAWFRLRSEFAHLSLLQGFDELLCLPLLHNVDTYWYQLETVRKVLKQFRGRVLLADEVGLGKTIEAGMVLKEYILRGMVERVLVLTPASMVGQWREEMQAKFAIEFASSYDPLLRNDAQGFWSQPRVIASIATARRQEHFEILRHQVFDLVIVDEAHHLKNRATSNWKLIDALQKRFLLLLSATPVQNSLVELYNLLTLLKPGIFKTEKEFRATYMTAGKPRVPANQERLRDLMRDAMIRNTRAQVEVKLPRRTAVTLRIDASAEEASSYQELSQLAQQIHQKGPTRHRLALRHLLTAAGSSPFAAASAIQRFAVANKAGRAWFDLYDRYRAIATGGKEAALIDLLQRNPNEKKIVFVHHRETLARLDGLLKAQGLEFARFDGSMSGPEKDAAIERFRDQAPLLLCTESGGEGRNLQFCNTLINFDLPWNPMAIEQRIGRLHRIGQTRQVFVFNLAVRHTIEEYVLQILDEKINMFELVVGEIDAILGEMDESQEFAEMVFQAWVETAETERPAAFDELGARIVEARRQYEAVKALDEKLFGDEFAAG